MCKSSRFEIPRCKALDFPSLCSFFDLVYKLGYLLLFIWHFLPANCSYHNPEDSKSSETQLIRLYPFDKGLLPKRGQMGPWVLETKSILNSDFSKKDKNYLRSRSQTGLSWMHFPQQSSVSGSGCLAVGAWAPASPAAFLLGPRRVFPWAYQWHPVWTEDQSGSQNTI